MSYKLKDYAVNFINKTQELINDEDEIRRKFKKTIDKEVLNKLLEKIVLYFENEAFFDDWEVYDPNLPRDFSAAEEEIIKICAGWSYWNSKRQSMREKVEKNAMKDPEERIVNAIHSLMYFDINVIDSMDILESFWNKLKLSVKVPDKNMLTSIGAFEWWCNESKLSIQDAARLSQLIDIEPIEAAISLGEELLKELCNQVSGSIDEQLIGKMHTWGKVLQDVLELADKRYDDLCADLSQLTSIEDAISYVEEFLASLYEKKILSEKQTKHIQALGKRLAQQFLSEDGGALNFKLDVAKEV